MRQGTGIYYYVLFKTEAPDGSAFFGIQRTQNPTFGSDGEPWTYIGNGPKLAAKAKQFGIARLIPTVIQIDGSLETIQAKLKSILTPATLADPRCLNMPRPPSGPEHGAKVSAALTDLPKSDTHRIAIAESMVGNDNALGHVKSDEVRAAISEAKTVIEHVSEGDVTVQMKYWHNPISGEQIMLEAGEEGLTGFKLGKLPKELAKKFAKKDFKAKPVLSDADKARLHVGAD